MKWMMLACLVFATGCLPCQYVYTPPAAVPKPAEPCPRLPSEAERKSLIEQSTPGPVPTTKELAEVEPVLRRHLKDPDSLKYLQFGVPYREMLWGDFDPDKYKFVWRVPFEF